MLRPGRSCDEPREPRIKSEDMDCFVATLLAMALVGLGALAFLIGPSTGPTDDFQVWMLAGPPGEVQLCVVYAASQRALRLENDVVLLADRGMCQKTSGHNQVNESHPGAPGVSVVAVALGRVSA